MNRVHWLLPDYVYVGDRFIRGVGIGLDSDAGVITRVGPTPDGATVERLQGRAILPGMINGHSHTFQRAIRGRTQWKPAGSDADFWSWRKAMYEAVLGMTPDDIYTIAHFCFVEMLLAGYTSVGEFHYLHRDPQGGAYAEPGLLARHVMRAARAAGIRLVLLNVAYATGGVGQPLQPEQRRFHTPDLDDFLSDAETLRVGAEGDALITVGVAPHSVRAVRREWLTPIAEFAGARDLPLHMHVSEQPAEVAACVAAYGLRPAELVAEAGLLNERFTAVHATHLSPAEIEMLGSAGANICACPTTERDLGDGILAARQLIDAGAHICIGSDSQTIIDPWEEIRLVEYHARLARLRRVILGITDADAVHSAPQLLRFGSMGGARALRLLTGSIDNERFADLVAIDLEHTALTGWTADTLASMLALSAPANVVRDVWVGGRRVVQDRMHADAEVAAERFSTTCRRILP